MLPLILTVPRWPLTTSTNHTASAQVRSTKRLARELVYKQRTRLCMWHERLRVVSNGQTRGSPFLVSPSVSIDGANLQSLGQIRRCSVPVLLMSL